MRVFESGLKTFGSTAMANSNQPHDIATQRVNTISPISSAHSIAFTLKFLKSGPSASLVDNTLSSSGIIE